MWHLLISGPGYFDVTHPLRDGVTTFGRAEENDVVLTGDLVSRNHARVEVRGDNVYVEDLGSRNGSRINEQKLRGTSTMRPGDVIAIGENLLTLRRMAQVENLSLFSVDLSAGGVRRFTMGGDLKKKVLVTKRARESRLLGMLDEVSYEVALDTGMSAGSAQEHNPYKSLIVHSEAAEGVSTPESLQVLLDDLVDWLMEKTAAQGGVVLLKHRTGKLVPVSVRQRGVQVRGELPVSDDVLGAVTTKALAMAVGDVQDERATSEKTPKPQVPAQVLAAPIGAPGDVHGVLYLFRRQRADEDIDELLDVCNGVARLAEVGLGRFRIADQQRRAAKLRATLERYHGPDILERRMLELAQQGGHGPLSQLAEQHVTTLVASLAPFSPLLTALPPERVVELLGEFYQLTTDVLFSLQGVVERIAGETVTAHFGVQEVRADDAPRAAQAALLLRNEWDKAMKRRSPEERCQMRIGLASGPSLVGIVGIEARHDFTVLGETAETAAWLCETAEPGQILVTQKAKRGIGNQFDVTHLGDKTMRQSKKKVPVLELHDRDIGGAVTGSNLIPVQSSREDT